jgi:hypothetical protein
MCIHVLPGGDRRLPRGLSHTCLGIDPQGEKDDEGRVIIRIVRRKIVGFSVRA